ncbi:hypothetical protein Pfo_010683 [Paulownia fortunei]|nr:hypothetical protein Pfo_010683 [Paulownia fortunei]
MRGKSSSSKSRNGEGLDIEKLETQKEPHLSSAYIRSLVKQLTSSRTKDLSNSKEHGTLEGEGVSMEQDLDGFSDKQEKTHHPPQQHKKQVRRRLHTRRPYQERMLNMAEARREIVSALKLHRAAMKQASEKQQPQQGMESGPEPVQENLNFVLPSQTLGLNLNLQDFNNLDTTLFHSSTNPSSIYSSSSPSTSSSPAPSAATEEIPYMGAPPTSVVEFGDSGLLPGMDDTEMAEIRSIGDQHQIEWNDTLNLETSAGWFKFLKSMEIRPEDQKDEDFVNSPFDEVMEFPAWLNANESCLQHVNDFCSDDYFQDPDLPCMDIEEIEGMDGDWLA